jgi:hypothetical protein
MDLLKLWLIAYLLLKIKSKERKPVSSKQQNSGEVVSLDLLQ